MKKLLLPSLLILAFGLVLAHSQNINKSIQLSQDPTGKFNVDTNNNSYWPGHFLSIGPTPAPILTSCGTSPTILGTDTAGTIVVGTGSPATGCIVTFTQAYLLKPYCVAVSQNPATSPAAYSTATTSITFTTPTALNGATLNYWCSGSQ